MSTPELIVKVQKPATMRQEMEALHHQIARRAYEIYLDRGALAGRDRDDWLTAEQELVWKPAIEILEKNSELMIQVAVAGIEPSDFTVRLTEEHLLIKSERTHSRTLFMCASLGLVRFSGSSIFQRESIQLRWRSNIGTGCYSSRLRLQYRKLLAKQHRFVTCSASR